MAKPLSGKLAIVTGASRGIGAAIAIHLASKGVTHLLLTHSSPSTASETFAVAAHIRTIDASVQILVIYADLGSLEGPKQIIEAAKVGFERIGFESGTWIEGGHKEFTIDILINNAGVSENQMLEDVDMGSFDWQYNVNVRGPLLLTQAAMPHLPHDRSGRIVNVSSVSATLGFKGQSVYGGTKAALDAMTRTWARELADRATVNAVNPGPVETRMYASTSPEFQNELRPFIQIAPGMRVREEAREALSEEERRVLEVAGGRSGTPDEVAGIVGMLCSPDSGWCTGSVVGANGGMIMGLS